ncbi:zinc-dependent peptidase [Carboxylicivirga sp. A043]|uniref:zinc-dependent peptidase n=1 Tax=Carboxylicivirga litoralis TaxID=2816963 RepID=UPI0021CAFCA1|nr:zinc-dependent peptidase [Carboxylicivirga sp. A043]MCU4157390.1 zinc-dependent peptidase [Carboxylicivirga sp. A043]
MTKEHLYVILIFIFGMLIALAFIADAYLKFKRSNTINLKVAQQSSKWKRIKEILEEQFAYYNHLPDTLKTDFILRTYQFMQRRNWVSSSKPIVDMHQKTLISASAIQLTFGLKQVSFGRFKTIIVHEDAYYNRLTRKYHRGEVNQAGLIVLSWKHFEQGYADAKDKINLGLHEMAHALDLALHLSEGRRYNVHRLMDKFRQSAFEKMLAMRNNPNGFLRQYGSTNAREFFSVAIEHFFEAPKDFRTQMPELYYELCQLLNQDPCNNIFRGFQSIHSDQFKNAFDKQQLKLYKPKINLKPNANILIPFVSYTLLVALVIPVINLSISTWNTFTFLALGILYSSGVVLIYSKKAKGLKILDSYLLSKTLLLNNDFFSVHLKNIVNINFTYMLTYYSTEVSYFEGDDIKTKQLSLYYSPASIKKLERLLLQQSIKIKHNNKWLNKEES